MGGTSAVTGDKHSRDSSLGFGRPLKLSMRAKQTVVGSPRQRVCGSVSLNPPGVKSSVKKAARRRVILRGLLQRSAADIASAARRQMAGDGGEAKRLPKRPFNGEVEENSSATVNENVKIHPGKKAPGERRGKENSAAKCTALTSGSAKMSQTVHGARTGDDPSIFFDEDSNHVFPVEQFFGNMDVVQDYQRRTPGSKRMSRREYRSMHYYAKEDSEDEHL